MTAPRPESVGEGLAKVPRQFWYAFLLFSAMLIGLAISVYMGWFDTDPLTGLISGTALVVVAIVNLALASAGLYWLGRAGRAPPRR